MQHLGEGPGGGQVGAGKDGGVTAGITTGKISEDRSLTVKNAEKA